MSEKCNFCTERYTCTVYHAQGSKVVHATVVHATRLDNECSITLESDAARHKVSIYKIAPTPTHRRM